VADVLIIDDQERYAELCRRAIPEHDYHGPARTWEAAEALLKTLRRRVDLVLLDVHFDLPPEQLLGLGDDPDDRAIERARREQGLHILARLRSLAPDLPVVLMTSRDDLPLEQAADELQAEEYTYFLDDEYVDAVALRSQIEGILRARRGVTADGPIYWGDSMVMRRVRSQLLTLARGRLPIILGGPTGTGKSLIARHFVHPRSGRKGRFVAVDLSTVPKDLMGAHLFGSVRGAYTGSISDRRGAFEEADGGTLFLDEIGNLSNDAQKMLLTVLQEGVVTRLGDVKERRVDVKLVVATHEDLPEMVREGRFRADLFMRLNPACTVNLPPLKDRKVDLGALASFFVEQAVQRPHLAELIEAYWRRQPGDRPIPGIEVVAGDTVPEARDGVLVLLLSVRAMRLLRKHPWTGNLREFAMTVENALVFTFAELSRVTGGGRGDVVQIRPKLIRDLLRATRSDLYDSPSDGHHLEVAVRPAETLNKVAADVERQYFTQLYLQHDGDFRNMARVLMGDPDCARKVQLRFNQLGLKVRELKRQLQSDFR
jgi:DNA-binding NtrC family response regulator